MLHCLPVVSPNHSLPYRHLVLRWRLLVLWANNLNYSSFPKHLLYFSYEFVSFLLTISQHSSFLHCMSRAVPGAASTCGIFKLPFFIILIWSLGLALHRFFFFPRPLNTFPGSFSASSSVFQHIFINTGQPELYIMFQHLCHCSYVQM